MSHAPTAVRWLFAVTALVWAAFELRQGLRSRPEARHRDAGSRAVIGICAAVGYVGALATAGALPGLAVPDRAVAAWSGLVLFSAGVTVRLWAFRALGRYFTFTVQTSPDQPVVDSGPYRFVRHPGYAAFLLTSLGLGLFLLSNWISALVLTAGVGAGLVYRIRVEERALDRDVGVRYREYARSHRRLVPFLW